jgi:hypothetical protein
LIPVTNIYANKFCFGKGIFHNSQIVTAPTANIDSQSYLGYAMQKGLNNVPSVGFLVIDPR